ncbi:hypothetical protein Bbelb_048930 [Branchiostoma belcheri]|nr:hypothetical protein Bbelb_048930 [Branchiostoma belcheri]
MNVYREEQANDSFVFVSNPKRLSESKASRNDRQLKGPIKRSKSAVDKVMKEMSAALTKSFKKDTPKKRQRKPSAVRFISGPNQLVICPYYDHRLIQFNRLLRHI